MRLSILSLLLMSTSALAAPPSGPHNLAPICTAAAAGAPSHAQRKCVSPHRIWMPGTATATWEDKLVVMLPGTDMEPNKHDTIGQIAAKAGFRTILLGYDNRHEHVGPGSAGISGFCVDEFPGDTSCAGDVADTVLWGPTASPPVAGLNYDDEDSVEARLISALDRLHVQDMLDGTNDYGFDGYSTDVQAGNWCNIIVAGFSQGSTVTGVLASQVDLGGAVMFDGPAGMTDVGGVPTAQDWRTGPHATDGSVMFGAYHNLKTFAPEDAWDDLGLPAGTDTVRQLLPFTWGVPAGIHRVEAFQAVPAGAPGICSNHMSMARDNCMPMAPGTSKPILFDAYTTFFEEAGAGMDPDCAP
ncbi:MAG: hypothetical protein AB8H79_04210 [Myxococcota bacterium]